MVKLDHRVDNFMLPSTGGQEFSLSDKRGGRLAPPVSTCCGEST